MSGNTQLNLFTENRWVLLLPRPASIGEGLPLNMAINITKFRINDRRVSSSKFGANGYQIDYPTNVVIDDKSVTISFLLDSAFRQYKFLYEWLAAFANPDGAGLTTDVSHMNELYTDVTLYPLSEYKSAKVIQFNFRRAWISELSGMDYDYQGNAKHITCTFKLHYERLEII